MKSDVTKLNQIDTILETYLFLYNDAVLDCRRRKKKYSRNAFFVFEDKYNKYVSLREKRVNEFKQKVKEL